MLWCYLRGVRKVELLSTARCFSINSCTPCRANASIFANCASSNTWCSGRGNDVKKSEITKSRLGCGIQIDNMWPLPYVTWAT